jgi:hypothetical protein
MNKKIFAALIIMFVSTWGFSQDTAKKTDETKKDPFPALTVKSDLFAVTMPTFSKKAELHGKGEVLEVQFEIINNTDQPHQLYIFILASYDETAWMYNSFNTKRLIPEKVYVSYFAPYPDNKETFTYDINGAKEIKKYPKDFKLGVDKTTGKIYTLKDKIIMDTEHICLFRKNYKFFDNVCVLMYDDEGEIVFRQTYALKGFRHR